MPTSSDRVLEIPSKTFIVGEYLAINGTASMVMATEPSFLVTIIDDKNFGFHPDSPAGKLKNQLGHNDFGYSFFDPHDGRGGFGRSTAEYLAVCLNDKKMNKESGDPAESLLDDLEDFVQSYQKQSEGEYKPSGADLVAQLCGGLCWYDGMNYQAEQLAWPFPGYDIFIFHTGKKLATHEHLKDLKSIDLRSLIPILVAARTSIDQMNLKVFCESVNYYYDRLDELGLSDKSVKSSVDKIRKNPEVLAAKGCGAMGVDTVIVVAESTNKDKILQVCMDEDFQFISSLQQAHPGATVRSAN